jgi:hypothetical protein
MAAPIRVAPLHPAFRPSPPLFTMVKWVFFTVTNKKASSNLPPADFVLQRLSLAIKKNQ